MVYKKYIKKDGKLYGPYIYQSKRINGKVVSEYLGVDEPTHKKKLIILILMILIISLILILIFNFFDINLFKKPITGKAILEQNNSNFLENNLQMSLSIKEGELIPEDSFLVIKSNNQEKKYPIKDLIKDNLKKINGEFYLENYEISGNGEGFGISGKKIIHPEIDFKFIIKKSENFLENSSSGLVESNTSSQSVQEPNLNLGSLSESTQEQQPLNQEQTLEKEVSEESEKNSENFISEVINNLFLFLTPTGKTIDSNNYKEFQGKVSKENPFFYNLNQDETFELIPGSVKYKDSSLKDEVLSIKKEDNKIIINTDYYTEETGFGEEYLGNSHEIPINLKFLTQDQEIKNLSDSSGLEIYLEYNGQKINSIIQSSFNSDNSINKNINEIKKDDNENILNEFQNETLNEKENETILENLNESNLTNFSLSIIELSEEEKNLFLKNFNENSLKVIKSEIYNGRYIIGYKLNDYYSEFSYDSNLYKENLRILIERDKIKWIRDILNMLKNQQNKNNPVNIPIETLVNSSILD
jgi:hypothetical protein